MGMPGMMPPHFPHPGMMPHHPGMMPHHPGMMPPHQGMMPPPYGHPPCSFAPGASGPNPPFFGQNQTASPEEHRNMRRAWRRWWRTTYAEPWKKCKKEKKEEKKREKKERKEKKKAEKMAEGGAAKAENESSSSSSSDEGEASPNGDYLKSVGESVAAMLDPLGKFLSNIHCRVIYARFRDGDLVSRSLFKIIFLKKIEYSEKIN